jgi:hypothetical protein
MTDREHANKIREAATALNAAISDAASAGLHVEISVHSRQAINYPPEPRVATTINRPVLADLT